MQNIIPLHIMPLGSFGTVKKLTSSGLARRRMLDLGLTVDTPVEALRKSPSGDPTAYQIRGAVIALRSEEAAQILIEPIS
jgi:ferrous iron transport protein A